MALRLEYGKLKQLLESTSDVKKSGATKVARVKSRRTRSEAPSAFMELLASPTTAAVWEGLMELEGRRGKMRIQWKGDGGTGPGWAGPGVLGITVIQIVPQMKILVALEAVDGRKGIDSLVRLCQENLQEDPFSGCLFVFRSRRGTSIRILSYDGQGFWLAQKRLSKGRFVWWPSGKEATRRLQAHQAQLLLAAGNPEAAAAPVWRKVST
jgi:hypothetical protein